MTQFKAPSQRSNFKSPSRIALILMLIVLGGTSCQKTTVNEQTPVKSSTPDALIENGLVVYPSVKIGTQIWMTQNLTVSRYRNGDIIPQVRNKNVWDTLTTGAWCWYNNNSDSGAKYGRLYNWYAVNDPRGLAPIGWHVPSDAEWSTLSTFLGYNAAGKLKDTGTIEAGTGLWHASNVRIARITNKTRFTGLPGGIRGDGLHSGYINFFGFWWSSTGGSQGEALLRTLGYNNPDLQQWSYSKRYGMSVRCIKD